MRMKRKQRQQQQERWSFLWKKNTNGGGKNDKNDISMQGFNDPEN